MEQYNYLFKVLIAGGEMVGKTCLMARFANPDQFNEKYISTIGVDFTKKQIKTKDDKVVKLQIWDTAGQERFKTITNSYYKGAQAILLVYDITNKQSFEDINSFVSDVKQFGSDNVVIVLVGNKNDLEAERQVEYQEGEQLAGQLGIQFIETSVKQDDVESVFMDLAIKLINSTSSQHKSSS